ncbi:hypothetical protein AVEN_5439-1 [Araneus ventricosus]|uniref:Uncharacterized protein n=1 Tax=Araneus ventricosus TaxID=182803 RepID=A0A4Y2P731_ARAVE|nr:hypothetical protein AVEN_5439-1 [Araneus ventricosus]
MQIENASNLRNDQTQLHKLLLRFTQNLLKCKVSKEENYNDLSMILENINYQENCWMVCGDFKMLTMLLGQQEGYTKYPCFLCLWDSRARDLHWNKSDWSLRGALTTEETML